MKSLTLNHKHKIICRFFGLLTAAMVFWMQNGYATPLALADGPLFLSNTATPIVMLNISKDHQLYFKAYDDFSDLDGDGVPDTAYKNSIDYYGYFDSYKCYTYNTANSRFEPSSTTSTKYCASGGSLWSGNFLNWASMSRIDTIRKMLYGGYRSTDTGTTIVSSGPVTSAPITSAPVATGPTSAPSSYTASSPVVTNTVTASVNTTISGPNCSLPANTNVTSSESAPSATTTGIPPNYGSTNSASTNSASTNSTPVTTTSVSPLGTTTTTAYDTTYSSTYTTTTPVSYYTTTHTTTVTTYAFRSGDSTDTCHDSGTTGRIKKTTVTTTYTTTYVSSTTTPYQTTTTTTTTTTTGPVAGVTVLERTYIPNDAHSFAKFYNGSDLSQLTPFTSSTGITLCNTTTSSTALSQNVTDPPLIRVAAGNYSLWNANERWQCRWSEEVSASNGNVTANSGLSAASSNPSKTSNGLGQKDYVARVKVCDSNFIGTESCKSYTNSQSGANQGAISLKPIGLLQTYGDNNQVNFGLLTGSYGKNKSGGVLRKNASSMNNEINISTDGTFKTPPATGGIINTLSKLRIYGYKHTDGTYHSATGSDNCIWGLSSYSDGSCTNWGNPQSEIFLESLRYLTNHSALSAFYSDDTSYLPGLTTATPANPINSAQWCAKLNVIEFNASSSSYDGDQLGSVTDIGASAMNPLTDAVGTGENIPGNSYFIGSNGTNNDQLCTPKTVSALSSVSGTCPDAPRLSGTYQIDGLAEYAHTNDLLTSLQGTQEVTTYGVALSPVQPVVTVPVPGSTTKTVKILPACQDTWNSSQTPGNCTLVDFKIVNQVSTDCSMVSPAVSGTANCGKIYVNWEDSEQGGDFDMDMWGVLTYAVTSTKVQITTQTIYQSTPYRMAFGYIVGGTTQDGFHAHSGINGYAYSDTQPGTLVSGITYCTNCAYNNAASTVSYQVGTTSASSLQQPLFYAAKWGGFNDYDNSKTPNSTAEWDTNNDGIPDRYFYATNPAALASSLAQALNDVIRTKASASAAAANSTSLNTGTVVYQAQFDSTDWSGHFYSFPVQADGSIKDVNGDGVLNGVDANWDAATLIPAASSRNIFTYNPTGGSGSGAGVLFQWPTTTAPTLSTSQTLALQTSASGVLGSVSTGQERLNWLRGDTSKEERFSGGVYRNRTVTVLGDIVNSDPVYTQSEDYGYSSLPSSAAEQSLYAAYLAGKSTRVPMVYDGANDGMLHGFRADINNASSGKEMFAFVPAGVYSQLSSLTDPGYTHEYFVDGSPSVSDAYLTGGWSTVLLGGLGEGGKSIYALNISNPAGFTASNVMWEYSGSTAASTDGSGVTDADGMGRTYSQPQVAKMNDGSWVAIFGNGYNSTAERAFLYIVNLNTGALIKKIATNTATSNGLSTPVLYDSNNDKIIDAAYAGDLQGNLWKFDLTGTSSGSWQLGNGGTALFSATDSSGKAQPITAKPVVGGNPTGGVLIYFGTGSYLTNADVSNTDTQSFYAIWDYASTGTLTRANLVQQFITSTVNAGTANPNAGCSSSTPGCVTTYPYTMNGTSTNTVDYSVKRGWFMDLTTGERVYSGALIKYGRIIFLSSVPSNDPCVPGGYSWLTELDMLSGGATATSAFDLNNDGQFNANDKLPNNSTASRLQITGGMGKTPVWLDCTTSGCTKAEKLISITSGAIPNIGNQQPPPATGTAHRKSWIQLQ